MLYIIVYLNTIQKIRSKIRIVKCDKSYSISVATSKKKMKIDTNNVYLRSDCMIVTNLTNDKIYTDEILLDYYNKIWDIEVFFKLIKNNFKFQGFYTRLHLDNDNNKILCNNIPFAS